MSGEAWTGNQRGAVLANTLTGFALTGPRGRSTTSASGYPRPTTVALEWPPRDICGRLSSSNHRTVRFLPRIVSVHRSGLQ